MQIKASLTKINRKIDQRRVKDMSNDQAIKNILTNAHRELAELERKREKLIHKIQSLENEAQQISKNTESESRFGDSCYSYKNV